MRHEQGQAGVLPSALEDSLSEDIDDALYEVDELLERWNNRLSIDNLSLAKRYADGALNIAILWSRSIPDVKTEYFCTVFQRELDVGRSDEQRRRNHLLCLPGHIHSEANPNINVGRPHRDKKGMFVKNVHLMESPEIVYPSFIRFKLFDDTDCKGRCATNFLRAEKFLVGTYWEIGVIYSTTAGVSVGNDQGNCEQVEGRSQIVDGISHETGPIAGDWILDVDAIDLISRIRLLLHDEGIGLILEEGGDLGFKPLNVLLGPVDLYPAATQW